jgi:hypothetical protein
MPEQISLTVEGRARLRVRGNVLGFVRCGGERRWVWGAFDETFQLARAQISARAPEGALRRATVISAWGLGGYARKKIQFVGTLDLSLPRMPLPKRLHWSDYPSPRLGPLSAQTICQLSQHEHE